MLLSFFIIMRGSSFYYLLRRLIYLDKFYGVKKILRALVLVTPSPDGYFEVIGVVPTPVVAVLAYTMQNTRQINSQERNKGV